MGQTTKHFISFLLQRKLYFFWKKYKLISLNANNKKKIDQRVFKSSRNNIF